MPKPNFVILALVTVILTVIVVSLVNVGMSIFYDSPNYSGYCPYYQTQETCETGGGTWINNTDYRTDVQGVTKPVPIGGYCQYDTTTCNEEYNDALSNYNQIRFYVFAGLGLVLSLAGLFIMIPLVQYPALLSGLVLIGESIIFNFANKTAVFITLIVVLILVSLGAWRLFRK